MNIYIEDKDLLKVYVSKHLIKTTDVFDRTKVVIKPKSEWIFISRNFKGPVLVRRDATGIAINPSSLVFQYNFREEQFFLWKRVPVMSTLWECPSCHALWPIGARPVDESYNFCPKCGMRLIGIVKAKL